MINTLSYDDDTYKFSNSYRMGRKCYFDSLSIDINPFRSLTEDWLWFRLGFYEASAAMKKPRYSELEQMIFRKSCICDKCSGSGYMLNGDVCNVCY